MCALSLLNLFLLLLLCLGDSSDPPVNLLYAGCLESGIGNLTLPYRYLSGIDTDLANYSSVFESIKHF